MEVTKMLTTIDQSRSLLTALSGQIFEGLASDNLLHFNLNAIYVQTTDRASFPRLIGTSLALYMTGISVSPFAVGLFHDILISFVIAIGLFAISLLYLLLFVASPRSKHSSTSASLADLAQGERTISASCRVGKTFKTISSALSPLKVFYTSPSAIAPSLSLLLYNTGQAFVFQAIMVYTSLRFGFTAKQNGLLISIAHLTSAVYLFFTLFAVPRIIEALDKRKERICASGSLNGQPRTADATFAVLSLTIQSTFLTVLGFNNEALRVYPIVCVFALGLATPSFIKSYTLSSFSIGEAPRAVAAMTIMETMGGLLGPLVLGGVQTAWPGSGVLFITSGIMGISAVVFGSGALAKKNTPWLRLQADSRLN